jgi:hypothetical protein
MLRMVKVFHAAILSAWYETKYLTIKQTKKLLKKFSKNTAISIRFFGNKIIKKNNVSD